MCLCLCSNNLKIMIESCIRKKLFYLKFEVVARKTSAYLSNKMMINRRPTFQHCKMKCTFKWRFPREFTHSSSPSEYELFPVRIKEWSEILQSITIKYTKAKKKPLWMNWDISPALTRLCSWLKWSKLSKHCAGNFKILFRM